jgi:hypothetical protein
MTHIKTHTTAWIAGAVVLLAAAGWGFGQDVDLTGRVQHMDKPGQSLDKRIEAAGQEFRRENREGLYMAGYVFPARDRINMGDRRTPDTRYQVRIKSGEIKIRRTYQEKNRDRYSVNTELDGGGPAGIFVISLHDSPKATPFLKGVALGGYATGVRKNAIFWLGQTGEEEALQFFEEILLKKQSAA